MKVTLRVRGGSNKKYARASRRKWTSDQFALGLLSFASTTAEAFRSRGETTTRTRKIKTKRKDEAPGRVMVTLRVDEEESLGKQKLEQNQVKVYRARTWHHPGDDDGSSFDREKKENESFDESSTLLAQEDSWRTMCNASFSVWRLSDERDLNESRTDEDEDEFREEKRHARKKQTFTPSYPAEKT